MSFNEFGVTIFAQNLASPEFARVAADAGVMASQISGQRIILSVENQASLAISAVGEDAARVKAQIEGSLITIGFAPVEVPSVPPIDVSMVLNAQDLASPALDRLAEEAAGVKAQIENSPISISFAPIQIPSIPPVDVSSVQAASVTFEQTSVSAANMGESLKASATGFTDVASKAETASVSLRTVSSGFMAMGHMGIAVSSLAGDFGILDKESAKWVRTIMSVITLMGGWIRLKAIMTTITTGHTASIAVNTTAESSNATASIATAVAHKIKAAATWIAVAAQNALNISHATFLALTGVGIAVVIAAAVAMAYFATQMNNATQGLQNFNSTAAETPSKARSVQRAGEDSLYRRGVE
jgi:hypothetical protein